MKKTIALASALLLTSSLFVGCGAANNAGPQTQGYQGAGKQQARTQSDLQNANMRADRNLEANVNRVLGTKGTKVYVSNNSAYVRLDPSMNAGTNRAGTLGMRNNYRTGPTGTGDRTAIDGTGGGLFGNRDTTYGGMFGNRDMNNDGLFGNRDTNNGGLFGNRDMNNNGLFGNRDTNDGGLFGTGLGNTTHNDTAGITRGNTLNNGAGGGAGLFNRGTTGYGTTAGDYTGYGAANGGRTDMYGTGTTAGRSSTFGTGAANHTAIGGTGLDTTTRTRVTQAIQKANPQIRNVYFITK